MTIDRTVNVKRQVRNLSFYNTQGEHVLLGELATDEFEGEKVRKLVFQPAGGNVFAPKHKREDGYSIGVGGSVLDVINPAEAMEPLLEAGWTIKKQYAIKGGLEMTTQFIAPDGEFKDSVGYDADFWGTPGERGSMFPMIVLHTSIIPGHIAAEYQVGIFRLVCTNGLVSSAFELPTLRYNHRHWDMQAVSKAVQSELPKLAELPQGRLIGSGKAVEAAADFYSRYVDARIKHDGEPDTFTPFEEAFPNLSVKVLKMDARRQLQTQLQLLADAKRAETVYSADLVNVYTNSLNAPRVQVDGTTNTDRTGSQWRAIRRQDASIREMTSLVQFADIFRNN